jgi:hypothetical protein
VISTIRFVAQQTEQMSSRSAGHARFTGRLLQSRQTTLIRYQVNARRFGS